MGEKIGAKGYDSRKEIMTVDQAAALEQAAGEIGAAAVRVVGMPGETANSQIPEGHAEVEIHRPVGHNMSPVYERAEQIQAESKKAA